MYHLIFILLLFLSSIELFIKVNKGLIAILFLCLTLFTVLRYGQGSDYFNYIYLINSEAQLFEKFLTFEDFSLTKEIGFSFISYVFVNKLNLPAELLIAIFSGLSFLFSSKFILTYSKKPIFSLFLFYCTFYLIYPFSAIRQALVVSVFLCYMVPLLHNRNYIKYYIILYFLYTIHYSAIILVILPFVINKESLRIFELRRFILISICFLLIGVGLSTLFTKIFFFSSLLSRKLEGYQGENFDIVSLGLRIFLAYLIFPLHKYYKKNTINYSLYQLYLVGFLIYLIFIFSPLISSRLSVYMRYLEFVLLVDVIRFQVGRYFSLQRKVNLNTYFLVIIVASILYVKNINSFIQQGSYVNQINFFNYPYVSVLNKDEIFKIREIPSYYYNLID